MAEAPTIHVDIVSAEGEIFSGAATEVFAPASQGEVGIWPRHAPLLSLLKAREVRVKTPDGAEHFFFVVGGALEVEPTRVTVLADTALRAKDIDEAAALAANHRAEEALRDKAGHITQAEALADPERGAAPPGAAVGPALPVPRFRLAVFWLASDRPPVQARPGAALIVALIYPGLLAVRVLGAAVGPVLVRAAVVAVVLVLAAPWS